MENVTIYMKRMESINMKRSTFSGRFIADAIIKQEALVKELDQSIAELDSYDHLTALRILGESLQKEKNILCELEDKIYEEVRN